MKQIFRRVIDGKGRVVVEEVPVPAHGPGEILVANRFSLISSGTEISTVKKDPVELGRQVLSDPWMRNAVKKTVFSGGLGQTLRLVSQELTLLRALGYSSAGVVLAKGEQISGIEIGDKVACAGTNFANHAEIIRVPKNLFVRVPGPVSFEDASFIRVAAIGMHGLRRARLEFGEKVGIVGLGLLGQLASRIALAAGLEVFGFDVSAARLELARRAGIQHTIDSSRQDPVEQALLLTGGLGLDAVLICASSSDKSVANQAMKMCRKQGRVVAVGIVRMDLERMPFFVNELDFRFSRGHGPGSRDENYEVKGVDYPYGYVRWTERRNMEEVARLMAEGRLPVKDLVGGVYSVDEAAQAYRDILSGRMKSVASLIAYPGSESKAAQTRVELPGAAAVSDGRIALGLIGCGNFTRTVLLPALARVKGLRVRSISSATGVNARSVAGKYGVEVLVTDNEQVFRDPAVQAVVVATRHDRHAELAARAAECGKHVFMEKPMALSLDEYVRVLGAVRKAGVRLMVGYNRRFAPLSVRLREAVCTSGQAVVVNYLVNVGRIPAGHWTLDPVEGGGRLLGEADHFFDLFCYWTGSRPAGVFAQCILDEGADVKTQYNFCVQVRFENGSLATLTYTGRGSTLYPKETAHVFGNGVTAVLSDFQRLDVFSRGRKTFKVRGDKGHAGELAAFEALLRSSSPSEIPWAPLCSLYALESLKTGAPVAVRLPEGL